MRTTTVLKSQSALTGTFCISINCFSTAVFNTVATSGASEVAETFFNVSSRLGKSSTGNLH